MKYFFILLSCLSISLGFAEDSVVETLRKIPGISSADFKEKIGLYQIELSNGMKLWLKPGDQEEDEIAFHVAALGGFSSIVSDYPIAGELAVQLARESGFGGMTSEQFTTFLYEHSLEFEPKIGAFNRLIYADGESGSIGQLMKVVGKLFTDQKFSAEGWEEAQILTNESITKLSADDEYSFEQAYVNANTQNFPLFAKITTNDLKRANFENSKKIFSESFSNPADFVVVIVGDFKPVEVARMGVEYLGAIPKTTQPVKFALPFAVSFPSGITHRSIHAGIRQGVLTHITFPLKVKVDESNIHQVAFACQLIEASLRKVITEKMDISYGVDVSYEFPLYPYLVSPWISIRFGSDDKNIERMTVIILKELTRLQSTGVSDADIESIKKLEEGSQDFWLQDNIYWGSMLTNYYYWGWNPEGIDYRNSPFKGISRETMNPFLKKFISLDNYSVFSAYPQ